MGDLDEIGLRHGTDKASNGHNYLDVYEQEWLNYRREQDRGIAPFGSWLELGWWSGASVRTWREWLPVDWQVTGLDIEHKEPIEGVAFVQGSQDDRLLARQVADQYGPFDVIVDDASHISRLTIGSVYAWWEHLKPGGLYFIEDLQVSYAREWGGNPHPGQKGPDGETTMQFIKRVFVDQVHVGHAGGGPTFKNAYSTAQVKFWPGLCMIKKGNE